MDNPSSDTQDYGVQPPVIPDDDAIDDGITSEDAKPRKASANPSSVLSQDHLSIINDIIGKIDEADNILVALSSDPSVDELATAIALSLSLDKLEKRVTAIYSGETPDALSFLKPEDTFESKPDVLQDFVIAINKDKADHLRYKIDGDYVKIFITPYRSRISQEDLEFSYGDFNVDLVIALDVANGVDLDDALREHGRIMHDASIVNITTAKPGKLGEIEWSDTEASSVSEMVAELLLAIGKLEKPEATALLTGIIAATDRFANSRTTPHSLEIASQLISAGANQQIIAKNIASELGVPRETTPHLGLTSKGTIADSIREKAIAKDEENDDPMSLDIHHHGESEDDSTIPSYKDILGESGLEDEPATAINDSESEEGSSTSSDDNDDSIEEKDDEKGTEETEEKTAEEAEDEALTEDLEATEATLSTAGAEVVPEAEKKSFSLEVNSAPRISKHDSQAKSESENKPESQSEEESSNSPQDETDSSQSSESPAQDDSGNRNNDEDDDGIVGPFGNDEEDTETSADETPTNEYLSNKSEKVITPPSSFGNSSAGSANPATSFAPDVASVPEANNIPDMNYMPLPGDEILPPPPTPPVDFSAAGTPPTNQMMPDTMSPTGPAMTPPPSNPFSISAPNSPFGSPTSSMNQSMPSMSQGPMPTPNSNPFMPTPTSPVSNPFATSPTMPNQPTSPQSPNAPGSFQIPGM